MATWKMRSVTPAADPARQPAPPGRAANGAARQGCARRQGERRRPRSDRGRSPAVRRSATSSPLQYSAISQPAASAWRARSAGVPDSAFMARSSVTRTPPKPIRPRMIAAITVGDNVAGSAASHAGYTMCADMAQGRSVFKANGSRSASRWFAATRGSAKWLSTRARPCPGACLPIGWTPAASRPAASALPSRATEPGSSASARSPITACAPGMARSSTGAAATSKPAAAQSRPISAPVSQAARRPAERRRANSAPIAAAGGCARQCGGRSRATRPPSWSTISTACGGRTRRSAATSDASCRGSSMLRANRITPTGGYARNIAASSADSAGPAMPTMAAFRDGPGTIEARAATEPSSASRCVVPTAQTP